MFKCFMKAFVHVITSKRVLGLTSLSREQRKKPPKSSSGFSPHSQLQRSKEMLPQMSKAISTFCKENPTQLKDSFSRIFQLQASFHSRMLWPLAIKSKPKVYDFFQELSSRLFLLRKGNLGLG